MMLSVICNDRFAWMLSIVILNLLEYYCVL